MAHMSGEIFFCGNAKKHLDIYAIVCYYTFAHGGIAQLGERLNGIQEVSGSIPLISTKNTRFRKKSGVFLTFLAFLFKGVNKGVNRSFVTYC